MKKTQQMKKLEEMLGSSRIVAGGFLGYDKRDLIDIIDDDLTKLERFGYSKEKISERMKHLTEIALPKLGLWVEVEENTEVKCVDYKGAVVCPWPHAGKYPMRFTTLRRKSDGEEITWTDLQVHMIEDHGFFEGRGCSFRLEPETLIQMLF